MRRALKFLHTIASCGLIGGLAAYAALLTFAPQDSLQSYANLREAIRALSSYVLLPSLAIALVSGLLAMAAHRPFMDTRWAWLKAILGLSLFEATLASVGSRVTDAAGLSAKVAAAEADPAELASLLAYEWWSLGAVFVLCLAQVALGIWRPRLATSPRRVKQPVDRKPT